MKNKVNEYNDEFEKDLIESLKNIKYTWKEVNHLSDGRDITNLCLMNVCEHAIEDMNKQVNEICGWEFSEMEKIEFGAELYASIKKYFRR